MHHPPLMLATSPDGPYSPDASGIMVPSPPVAHRNEEFVESQLDVYYDIEARHLWFAGRRRFVTRAVQQAIARFFPSPGDLRAIDLGAGAGGQPARRGTAPAGRRIAELHFYDREAPPETELRW